MWWKKSRLQKTTKISCEWVTVCAVREREKYLSITQPCRMSREREKIFRNVCWKKNRFGTLANMDRMPCSLMRVTNLSNNYFYYRFWWWQYYLSIFRPEVGERKIQLKIYRKKSFFFLLLQHIFISSFLLFPFM